MKPLKSMQFQQDKRLFPSAYSQDTSTQAMTEVALGLSMAFFAILIVALLSMGNASVSDTSSSSLHIQETIPLNHTDTQTKTPTTHNDSQINDDLILVYWEGQYFDTQLEHVNVSNILTQQSNVEKPIIIAISPDTTFEELGAIHTAMAGKNVELTALNSEWQSALALK